MDDELDELQDKLDNNPAVQAEAYEKYVREYGTVFVTEDKIADSITKEAAEELSRIQDKEIADMDSRLRSWKKDRCFWTKGL